jgi:hypothetical protein
MNGMLRVPRSRGALSGVLLVLLGAWGALVPFIGPYFHFAYTPDSAWTYTSGRLWLEILPGAGALLGGLVALTSAYRHFALFGAWLAVISGGWFVLGNVLRPLWNGTSSHGPAAGTPVGSTMMRMWEQVGFFTGLGALIMLLAAVALGRFTVIGAREASREPATAPASTAPASTAPASTAPSSRRRFTLRRRADEEDSEPQTERVGAAQ